MSVINTERLRNVFFFSVFVFVFEIKENNYRLKNAFLSKRFLIHRTRTQAGSFCKCEALEFTEYKYDITFKDRGFPTCLQGNLIDLTPFTIYSKIKVTGLSFFGDLKVVTETYFKTLEKVSALGYPLTVNAFLWHFHNT